MHQGFFIYENFTKSISYFWKKKYFWRKFKNIYTHMSSTLNYEKEVSEQVINRRTTIEFITIVNDLWYEKSIELVLFRNSDRKSVV